MFHLWPTATVTGLQKKKLGTPGSGTDPANTPHGSLARPTRWAITVDLFKPTKNKVGACMVIAMATGTPSSTHPPPSVLYVPLLFLVFSAGRGWGGSGAACSLRAGRGAWLRKTGVRVRGGNFMSNLNCGPARWWGAENWSAVSCCCARSEGEEHEHQFRSPSEETVGAQRGLNEEQLHICSFFTSDSSLPGNKA